MNPQFLPAFLTGAAIRRTCALTLACLLLAGFCLPTQAAIVQYEASDVFFNVEDPPGVGLFGTPTTVGNNLVFKPTAFEAKADNSNGGSSGTIDQQLSFNVTAKNGFEINQIRLYEWGDFRVQSSLSGNAARATISMPIFTININGTLILPPSGMDMVFLPTAPMNGVFHTDEFDGPSFQFTGEAIIDVAALMAANNISGPATYVEITLDNTLNAQAEANASAFIKKKGFVVTADSNPVIPEPASLGLLGMAFLGFIPLSRRQRRTIA